MRVLCVKNNILPASAGAYMSNKSKIIVHCVLYSVNNYNNFVSNKLLLYDTYYKCMYIFDFMI